VPFRSLDFVITMEGELVQAIMLVQPPPPTSLDAIVEALEELQLSALEARAPQCDQILDFDFERLEHLLTVYLGPHRSWEDLWALTFSFVNIMTQLAGREPLSSDTLTQGALTTFPYGLHNIMKIIERHMA
jgi:hypothetical protein